MIYVFIFYIIRMTEKSYIEDNDPIGEALVKLVDILLEIEAEQEGKEEDQ